MDHLTSTERPAATPSTLGGAESLGALIAACQRNEREAQRQLYERFRQSVGRLARRMVGEDAADLTQQVFLQLFRTVVQFAGQSRFETWLYRLAVNECLQHLRRQRRRSAPPLVREPAARSADHTDRVEQQDLLQRALERLEPELRSVFLLRELEDLSYKEIAEAAGIPAGTVGSRLNRARRELKQHLRDLGWEF